MGHRLTFTKYPKIVVKAVTDNALLAVIEGPNASLRELWIPRSNIRSDDDARMSEVKFQLETHRHIKTHMHIADWYVRAEMIPKPQP